MNFNYAWVVAASAAVTAFWGQLKLLFMRLNSLLVVSVKIDGGATGPFMQYCWKHFKKGRLGNSTYNGFDIFIQPLEQHGIVGAEIPGTSLTFFRGWRPLFVSRAKADGSGSSGDHLVVSYLRGTFDIETLLVDAINKWNETQHKSNGTQRYRVHRYFGAVQRGDDNRDDQGLLTKAPSGDDRYTRRPLHYKWDQLGPSSSKSPFQALAYDKDIDAVITRLRHWKASEKWYREKGIPWRMGCQFVGTPGTGKTSCARAIAQEFDMPVAMFDLVSMTNADLTRYWNEARKMSPCIALFEDLDRVFNKDVHVNAAKNPNALTLDCLLNVISGVETSDGMLVIVTANDPTKLDPAMGVLDKDGKSTRPGRIDVIVEFKKPSAEARRKIAERILCDYPDLIDDTVQKGGDDTGAQFQNRCETLALARYWANK